MWRTGWGCSYILWGYHACCFTVTMHLFKNICLKFMSTKALTPRVQLIPVTIQNLGQHDLELWSKNCTDVIGLLSKRSSSLFRWGPSVNWLLPSNPEKISVKIPGDLNRRCERSLLGINFTAPCLWTSNHVLPLW